jgi:hypothetical protein
VVEVDDQLAQRRRPAAVFAGDAGVTAELERDEAGARQLSRLEAAVGAQNQVFVFDQRRPAAGHGSKREGRQGGRGKDEALQSST